MAKLGQGQSIADNYKVTVEYPGEIVPSSKLDDLKRYTEEVVAGLRSVYGAMQQYHGWDDARASREMDHIAAEHKRHLVEIGYKDLVDIIDKRQSVEITTAEAAEAEETLFKAGGGAMPADTTANTADDDDKKDDGGGGF
jgi:hypothetical protein